MLRDICVLALLLSFAVMLDKNQAKAATDDVAFTSCIHLLDRNPLTLNGGRWQKKMLPSYVEASVVPMLYGSKLERWISHKNRNGTESYIVMARDLDPDQMEDDFDDFFVVIANRGHARVADDIASNAMVFSLPLRRGIISVFACMHDQLASEPLTWNGYEWVGRDN